MYGTKIDRKTCLFAEKMMFDYVPCMFSAHRFSVDICQIAHLITCLQSLSTKVHRHSHLHKNTQKRIIFADEFVPVNKIINNTTMLIKFLLIIRHRPTDRIYGACGERDRERNDTKTWLNDVDIFTAYSAADKCASHLAQDAQTLRMTNE